MNLKKQYKNLKLGAKRLFVGLLILSLFCTATGIGSIFAYAGEEISTASEEGSIFEKLEENGTGGSEGGEGGGTLGSAEGDTEDDEKLDSFVNDLIEGAGESTSEVSSQTDGDGNGDVVGTGSSEKSGDPVASDSAASGGNTNPDGSTGSSSGAVDEKGTGADGDGSPAAGGTASTASTSASTEETSIPAEGTTDAADGLSASTEGKTAATESTSTSSDNKATDASGSAVSSASSDAVSSDASSLATSEAQLRKAPSTLDASKGASVEHVHDYTFSYDKKDEIQHYANCSCGQSVAENHKYGDWTYNNDASSDGTNAGTHTGTCVCGATKTEKCDTNGTDGKCSVCGSETLATNTKSLATTRNAPVLKAPVSIPDQPSDIWLYLIKLDEKGPDIHPESIEYAPFDNYKDFFASFGVNEGTQRGIGDDSESDITYTKYRVSASSVQLLNSPIAIDQYNSFQTIVWCDETNWGSWGARDDARDGFLLPTIYSVYVNSKNIEKVSEVKIYEINNGTQQIETQKNFVDLCLKGDNAPGKRINKREESEVTPVELTLDEFNNGFGLYHRLSESTSSYVPGAGEFQEISSDNYDLTITIKDGDVPIADGKEEIQITAVGKGQYYEGTLSGKVVIEDPKLQILYNGKSTALPQGTPYVDKVLLSLAETDYEISLDNSSWGKSVEYTTKCPDGNDEFYLYVKKNGVDPFRIVVPKNTFSIRPINLNNETDREKTHLKNIAYMSDVPYTLVYSPSSGDDVTFEYNTDYTTYLTIGGSKQEFAEADGTTGHNIVVTANPDSEKIKGAVTFANGYKVDPLPLTFDDETTQKTFYFAKVTVKPSDSKYKISKTNGSFADSVEFTVNEFQDVAEDKYVYIQNPTTSHVIRQKISQLFVGKGKINDENEVGISPINYTNDTPYTLKFKLLTPPTTLEEGKDFTQALDGSTAPLFADGESTYYMKFTGQGNFGGDRRVGFKIDQLALTYDGGSKEGKTFLGKVVIKGPSNFLISQTTNDDDFKDSITYATCKDEPQDVYVYLKNKTTGFVVRQKIADLMVSKGKMSDTTVSAIDYTADSPFTVTYNKGGITKTLVAGTDYEFDVSDKPSDGALVADGSSTYTMKITGKGDFEGEKNESFKVNALTGITYNGSTTKESSYDARVKLAGPSGFQASLKPDISTFAESATFNTPGKDRNVTLYLKRSSNNRVIKQVIDKISIVSVDLSELAGKVTLTPIDYISKSKPYILQYTADSYTLQEGTDKDFTVKLTTPSDEAVAIADGNEDTNVLTFTGVNGFTGQRTKKYKVKAQTLTFDGAPLTDSKTYIASVNIQSTGWKLSLSADGTFEDSLKYDKEDKDQSFYVYLKKTVDDGDVLIRQMVEGITIAPPPYTFDSFFSSTGGAPTAATNLIYNGGEQSLLVGFKSPTVPAVLEDEKITIIYNESELTDAEKKATENFKPTSIETNFKKTDAGEYKNVTYYVAYRYQKYKDSAKKDELAHKIVIASRDYGTIPIAQKPISEVITPSSKLVTESSGNYDYVKSNVDFEKDAFTLSMNDKALVEGTDFTRTINPALPKSGEIAPVGEHYAINYTGKGNYTGTVKYTVEVVDEDVTYNGSKTKESKYPNKVKIGAPSGFKISFDENGDFNDSVTYDKIGESQTVTVYLKNDATGRMISKKITGLTITGMTILFDGKPTQNKFYYTSCRISADGYTVSYVNSEESKDYGQYYLANKAGKYPDFPLYFRNEDTGEVTKVIISNLWIKKDIDLPVKYNGGTYREWFNTDVKLTCDGYEISESGKNNFKDYYLVTKDGVNTYTLDFRSKSDKADIQTFDIIIRIRRSMSGSMLIRVSSQDVNVTSSSDTKAAEEEAAAREKFQKYFDAYKNGEIQKTEDEELNTLLDAYKEGTITIDDVVEYYKAKDKSSNSGTNTSIVSDDYTSDEWKGDDSVSLITKEPRKISFEYNALTTDIDYILYTISEQFYSSVGDMEAEISEKSSVWRAYDDDARPTLPKNKKSYVYAKFYDTAGNCTTLSTGALIYDTVVPKMSTLSITSKEGTEGTIVAVAAKDTLSGVNKFKFKYEEKTKEKNPETPKKTDLNENGTVIEVSSESDGFSGGTYIVKDLDPDKTYVFFAIAIDRAGNISEVDRQEGQGVGGKKKEEEKKADSSLTPAPNGAAGGGDKQADAGSGSGAGAGAGAGGTSGGGSIPDKKDEATEAASDSGLGKNDREITRDPYIEDATGNVRIGKNETSGWTKITNEINSADQGATVYVQMSGTAEVPKEMIDSIGKRDVVVQFMVNDGVKWTVKSSDLANAQARDVNMSVKMGSKGIPVQALNDLVGTKQHIEFGVQNPEDFGFNARITVPVGNSNRGMKATLYYYDTETKELKAKEESTVDENGNASFDLNTASECTIVLSTDGMLAAGTGPSASTELLEYYPDTNEELVNRAAITLPDLFSLNGNVRIWLFIIAFTSAALCIAILFMPSMQSDNDRRNSY